MARWLYFTVRQVWCPFIKDLFKPHLVETEKKIVRKKINRFQHKHEKQKKNKTNGVPLRGLNAMPFQTKAWKWNHWITYMHMKCSFYWQPHFALENVLWKNEGPCISYRFLLKSIIESFQNKRKWPTNIFAGLCLLDAS